MYPNNEWEKVQTSLSCLNVFDSSERHFLREFLSYVSICELDTQNRILLPQKLIDYAQFKKEVILIGLLDKIEIWAPELKKVYDDKQNIPFEKIAEMVTRNIKPTGNPS